MNSANFSCFVSCSTFHKFPFFFFSFSLLYSSIAQTLKNVGQLDCKLRLQRRSISLDGKISRRSSCTQLTFSLQTQQTFVWLLLLLLLLFLSFISSLFFSVVTSNYFFFGVGRNCRSPRWLRRHSLDNHTARRYCIGFASTRPRVTSPWARELDFSVFTVFKPSRDWVDHAKACLVPLKKKKNLSLRYVSKPKVPYTYQPTNLHRANARIERKVSWWVLVASHCFRSSYLSLSFVIHGRVSLWHAVGRFQRHFSIPQRRSLTNIWRPSTFQSPQELAVHRSLLFVQLGATQLLGNVKFGLDSEKRSLPVTLEVWRRKLSVRQKERTAFISLHAQCTSCFACFSVSPPFCARNFDE